MNDIMNDDDDDTNGISNLDTLLDALPEHDLGTVGEDCSQASRTSANHTNHVHVGLPSVAISARTPRLKLRFTENNFSPKHSQGSPRDEFSRKQKVVALHKLLRHEPVDIVSLRQMAISKGGFITDELRQKAWPKLLDVDVDTIPTKPKESVLKAHRDYQQVVMDVNRSLKRFPPGMEDEQRLGLQDQLVDTIMRVLVRHPELHYYQGYHDIVVTFLLVVGEDITFALVDKLSTHHLRDFMDRTMDRTNHMLNYLYPIIGRASPPLREYMDKAELGTIFCLPWLITWYGHVLSDFRHVVRLYDFFLACHPLMAIYLSAAIVLYRETEVLETECDMAMIHCLLSKIPSDLPLEHLVSRAGDLFIQFPPGELAHEAKKHYLQSLTILNYEKFAEITFHQRPESKVLRETFVDDEDDIVKKKPVTLPRGESRAKSVARYTVWAVSAGLSAAAIAAFNRAMEWEWF